MNRYSNLKIKSEQNYKIAEIAREKEYYDVAVSRYYYSLFQLVDYILYSKKDDFDPSHSENSHVVTITEFNKFVCRKLKKKLQDEEITDLLVLADMKRWRKQADYNKDRLITKEEFDNDFIIKFNSCYRTIHTKILDKEE
ncbi:HEPN domain-containing protein [Clostridium beijerinckii]|uniref:HEPN domain-containing protein n=1 Tax=Clostridium beijerinckii TaxID=1520 RepID=A0A1S9N9C6_CLOBE|nr:HEPN domain-containing protein [Clostridium beijerinckii]OOP74154.1 hypothetical protein CBEIBR21_06550 [Clostridium beijerinckii]